MKILLWILGLLNLAMAFLPGSSLAGRVFNLVVGTAAVFTAAMLRG